MAPATEATRKVPLNQRRWGLGMKWKKSGAAAVLSLPYPICASERWSRFRDRIDSCKSPVTAGLPL